MNRFPLLCHIIPGLLTSPAQHSISSQISMKFSITLMRVVHALYMNPTIVGTTVLYKEVSLIQGLINNMVCVSPTLCPSEHVPISECPHREVPLYVCVSWSQSNGVALTCSFLCLATVIRTHPTETQLYYIHAQELEERYTSPSKLFDLNWIPDGLHVTVSGTCSVYGIGTLVSHSQPHPSVVNSLVSLPLRLAVIPDYVVKGGADIGTLRY